MSKLNILGIVRGIKAQTTYLTPIIEAVCNSIDSIGKRKKWCNRYCGYQRWSEKL